MAKIDGKENQPENDEISDCAESHKRIKKKHKKRKHEDKKSDDKEVHSFLSEGEEKKKKKRHHEIGLDFADKNVSVTKQKCRDGNSADVFNNNMLIAEVEQVDGDGLVKKKKKKKKKHEDQSQNGCETEKKHKKKKKHKSDIDRMEESVTTNEVRSGSHSEDIIDIKRKKEKRKKYKEQINECEDLAKDSQKKCKRSKHKYEGNDSISSKEFKSDKKAKKERKKKKHQNVLENTEVNEKHKCQEIIKNKEEMSEYSKGLDSKSDHVVGGNDRGQQFGQWNSADLGTTDRKQKFLRLLGGFKEPSTNHNQLEGVQMKLLNIAMGSSSQASYMNKLEEEYEKARDISIFKPKGVGLGYEPVPGQGTKLHINPVKSRSIKFDD